MKQGLFFLVLGLVFLFFAWDYSAWMATTLEIVLVALLGVCGAVNVVTGSQLIRISRRKSKK